MKGMRKSAAAVLGMVLGGTGAALGVPDGWQLRVFAGPPEVDYPTGISAAANGDVYVSSDPNGSLGKEPQFGRIQRVRDTDGDGRADQIQDFVPHVTSPRGSHYVGGTLYLIHPPYLSAYRDTDGDGVADEQKVLVKGFGWGIEHPRGADHTTNGVRMGIDGWLYVAVGDFGMPEAQGADGRRVTLHGGGVARVRPDGSELELFAVMTRNICDTAISPRLDLFARDNTNDGKGWNTRFHHFAPMGDCGYPRLYQHFAGEAVAPLADYGGGSGTGALYLDEPGFPAGFGDTVYTTDWTTGKVLRHPLAASEATFRVQQEVLHDLPRAVDIDVDGSSRLYLADWRNGGFKFDPKAKVGMIQQVLPPNWEPRAFPDLRSMDEATLVAQVGSESAVMRLEAQRELLARSLKPATGDRLLALARDTKRSVAARAAAIFTYKQLTGAAGSKELAALAGDPAVREFALRALADRKSQLQGVTAAPFVAALGDPDPRVQVQALNGLARLGDAKAAPAILAAAAKWKLDTGIVAHVGIKALVALDAGEACLAVLDDPARRAVALRALQEMHTPQVVDGLTAALGRASEPALAEGLLGALARLYHDERPWDLKEWWGTRPDDRGPYFNPVEWSQTGKVRGALEQGFARLPEARRADVLALLTANRVPVSKLSLGGMDPLAAVLAMAAPDEGALGMLGDAARDKGRKWEQRVQAYQAAGRVAGPAASEMELKILAGWMEENAHPEVARMVADYVNASERGDDVARLVALGKRGTDSESRIAWQALLAIHRSPLSQEGRKKEVAKRLAELPLEVGFFAALADLGVAGYDAQIEAGLKSDNEKTIRAAEAAKRAATSRLAGRKVGELPATEVRAAALRPGGDVALGARLFIAQGCIACHAVDPAAVQKGPYLGAAGAKFQRDYLIDSVLNPDAVVAQGFQSVAFKLRGGRALSGFVTSEQDGRIEVRDLSGRVSQIQRADVLEEQRLPNSTMPRGLAAGLSVDEFTALIEYLCSLKALGG